MQLTVQKKKLYTNLGIGLLAGGGAVTLGGGVSALGFNTEQEAIFVGLFLTGVTVGPSAILAGSVLLGLGLAAKVKN